MDIRVTLEKPKHKYNRRVGIFINSLDGSLLVVFSIQNLFATHRTDAFLVGTALTVMRTWLVYRTFTNSASGELIFSIWIKPCFLRSQSFVFVQLPSTTFCGIPGPVLPCVWSDNPAEFLFTYCSKIAKEYNCHLIHTLCGNKITKRISLLTLQ